MSIEIISPKKIYEVKRLTQAERERAMLAPRNLYSNKMPCMVCGFRWMQHKGTLCPSRPGYFSQSLRMPIAPIMGDTEFLPDERFYKEPDFDVT